MRYRILLIFAILSLFTRCVFAGVVPPSDIERIIKSGRLVVAMYNKDIPPFFYQDEAGNLVGYDVALAQNLAKQLEVRAVFERHAETFDQVIDEVAAGRADIAIGLLSRTLPRALKVSFTQPYLQLPQALLFNRLKAAQLGLLEPVKDIINKPGISIGVLDKSSYILYAQNNFPNARIVLYTDIQQGMQDVLGGKIFAVFLNTLEIQNWLHKKSDAHLYLKLAMINNKNDPIAIAVPWNSPHLLAWISLYLQTIQADGTDAQLKQQYFTAQTT